MTPPPVHIAPSNFGFVGRVWPALLVECRGVERDVRANPTASVMGARRVMERLVHHIWEFRGLGDTGGMTLFELVTAREFVHVVANQVVVDKLHLLRLRGNDAAHSGGKPITPADATMVTKHLFDLLVWATRFHSAHPEFAPGPDVRFDEKLLGQAAPDGAAALQATIKRQGEELEEQRLLLDEATQKALDEKEKAARERASFLLRHRAAEAQAADAESRLEAERKARADVEKQHEAELRKLRAELAASQAKLAVDSGKPTAPLAISESETRLQLINPMLAHAGFAGGNVTPELKVHGMPNKTGIGYADYVLWDDDRKPLAVIEAKKSMESMSVGAEQVRLYADCIEAEYGQRPVMFCTNGFHIDMIDDAANLPGSGAGYPAREVEGYPTARQLRAIISRRHRRTKLADAEIDADIAGRGYQQEAIRAVAETFEVERHREALLVMATGTGKTRVAIALSKLLRTSGWVGKVLFLADRTALVNQAHKSFQSLYPESTPVNVLRSPNELGEVYISTYNTMMGLISDDGEKPTRFNPFDFDLIIIDEAHRSVYNRFKRIIDYFDAYVVGLTATPKSDLHHDTYALFGIGDKQPTAEYNLGEAVADHYLVPFKTAEQTSLFLRAGVDYDSLSEDEKLEWDKQDWGTDEDGTPLDPPDGIPANEINKYLYNLDTIRGVLKTVVTHGIRVGGDQLGKTIIFARSQAHAELIKEVFDKSFPEYSLKGASVITHSTKYAQSALDTFSQPDSGVNIAISVDMLDTGVDVPEVVNLVFFKPVYSPTKFWQMVGRGTRLCPNLFGPSQDKTHFLIFDFCGNLPVFFSGEAQETSPGRPRSLSEKLFDARIELLAGLDKAGAATDFRSALADDLHGWTASVDPGHIMVRPADRETLLRFAQRSAWDALGESERNLLHEHIAHLPIGTMEDNETSKRFDLIIVKLQTALLTSDASFDSLRQRVEAVAGDLISVKDTIPMVKAKLSFLERVLDPEWWDGVCVEELEDIRRGLRDLIKFVPKGHRNIVVFDLADEMGEVVVSEDMPTGLKPTATLPSQIENRIREVLAAHANDFAMIKLRTARPLNAEDVATLERIVAEAGAEGTDELRKRLGGDTVPAFIRRLVGLDETAIRERFADLLANTTLTASQIRFVRTLVEVLVHNGGVTFADLFDAPFDEEGNIVDIFRGNENVIFELRSRLENIEETTRISS